ncbi:MAG: SPOR domain-containing protein [Xanthomonadaceae bacterium]|nr:SPOR domain-containing protein [Xanthomonadaceae bacterium]
MDTTLKKRLIGAIVLVALAVIFLPMLIKGPAPDSGVSDVSIQVPNPPGGQYETRELPLVTPGQTVDGEGVVGMNGAVPVPAAPSSTAAETPSPGADGRLPPTTAGGNYVVSFGAYATTADADMVIARLKQSDLPGFREQTAVNGRPAWRVRIGPYADRAQAEIVRLQAGKVRSDVNIQVIALDAAPASPPPAPVVAPRPAAPVAVATDQPVQRSTPATPATPAVSATPATTTPDKPVTAPVAAATTGFVVQLGAFANANDANALRDRARTAGFTAFVEQVRTDDGMLNRVRVGPVVTRAEAETMKASVAAKLGIDGMVRQHP